MPIPRCEPRPLRVGPGLRPGRWRCRRRTRTPSMLTATGGSRTSTAPALAHRTAYNIRLINLSLGMPALPSYKANPLDAAVEIAWMRGVAVVVAAGNGGPATGTVDSPGDDPYAITVGATDDQGTDRVAD